MALIGIDLSSEDWLVEAFMAVGAHSNSTKLGLVEVL